MAGSWVELRFKGNDAMRDLSAWLSVLPFANALALGRMQALDEWPADEVRRRAPTWLPWAVLIALAAASIGTALRFPDIFEPSYL